VHEVAPVLLENVPTGHRMHVLPVFEMTEKEPIGHGTGVVVGAGVALGVQKEAPADEVVPNGHVMHDDALETEKELAGHGIHADAPSTLLYCPARHARHEVIPIELGAEYWPKGHACVDVEHVLAPAGDVKPVVHDKHEVMPTIEVDNVTL
jgi:hypothetical protein